MNCDSFYIARDSSRASSRCSETRTTRDPGGKTTSISFSDNYSDGLNRSTFGEGLQRGYGYATYNTGEKEHFLFGGVGGDVGVVKGSISLYGSRVSGDSLLKNQFGINFDGGFLVFGAGTGTGINTDSLTSCVDKLF